MHQPGLPPTVVTYGLKALEREIGTVLTHLWTMDIFTYNLG